MVTQCRRTEVSSSSTFGLITDPAEWKPLTYAHQRHFQLYGDLIERQKGPLKVYKELFETLKEHVKKLNETNKSVQFSPLSPQQIEETRAKHLLVQTTFKRVILALTNFYNGLHAERDALSLTPADWEEKNKVGKFTQLHRIKQITSAAARAITQPVNALCIDMERELQFFIEQSDRLYEVLSHDDPTKAPYRLSPTGTYWWTTLKQYDYYLPCKLSE